MTSNDTTTPAVLEQLQRRSTDPVRRILFTDAVHGTDPQPVRITSRDVLDFATLQGARTNGLADVTGSLPPGKKADLLVYPRRRRATTREAAALQVGDVDVLRRQV